MERDSWGRRRYASDSFSPTIRRRFENGGIVMSWFENGLLTFGVAAVLFGVSFRSQWRISRLAREAAQRSPGYMTGPIRTWSGSARLFEYAVRHPSLDSVLMFGGFVGGFIWLAVRGW
jgi:hypothetical protein